MQLSAMKTTIKQRDKQICELEKSNKILASTVSQLKSKSEGQNSKANKNEKSFSLKRKIMERNKNDYKNDILKLVNPWIKTFQYSFSHHY